MPARRYMATFDRRALRMTFGIGNTGDVAPVSSFKDADVFGPESPLFLGCRERNEAPLLCTRVDGDNATIVGHDDLKRGLLPKGPELRKLEREAVHVAWRDHPAS